MGTVSHSYYPYLKRRLGYFVYQGLCPKTSYFLSASLIVTLCSFWVISQQEESKQPRDEHNDQAWFMRGSLFRIINTFSLLISRITRNLWVLVDIIATRTVMFKHNNDSPRLSRTIPREETMALCIAVSFISRIISHYPVYFCHTDIR